MKYLFFCFSFVFVCTLSAQEFDGQWRGYFNSSGDIVVSGSNTTEYVLELEISGDEVSGFSYSYFQGRRYYVICALEGNYNKKNKSIKVVETKRVKGNTPPDFNDCLQSHYLHYEKEGKLEQLVGRWETAPGQRTSCGVGRTTLVRRTVSNDLSSFTKPATKNSETNIIKSEKNNGDQQNKKSTPDAVNNKNNAAPGITNSNGKEPNSVSSQNTDNLKIDLQKNKIQKDDAENVGSNPFQNRKTEVLKKIEIENETFKVDLYDNGEVDGDIVSVYFNGKPILLHKKLTDRPLTLTLSASSDKEVNELVVHAENLGDIPPNTALMIITDGDKRYEARISSDLTNSGTVHFIHKSKAQ